MVKTKYMHETPWYCDVCKNDKNYTLGGKWTHLKSSKHKQNACDEEFHNDIKFEGLDECFLCNKKLIEPKQKQQKNKCCVKTQIIKTNEGEVCTNCGLVLNYNYVPEEYVDYNENKLKIKKRKVFISENIILIMYCLK